MWYIHFKELPILRLLLLFYLHFALNLYFGDFSNIYQFSTQEGITLGHLNRYSSFYSRKPSKTLCKDLELMYKEVCQVLRWYLQRYGRYLRKTREVGSHPQAVAGYEMYINRAKPSKTRCKIFMHNIFGWGPLSLHVYGPDCHLSWFDGTGYFSVVAWSVGDSLWYQFMAGFFVSTSRARGQGDKNTSQKDHRRFTRFYSDSSGTTRELRATSE